MEKYIKDYIDEHKKQDEYYEGEKFSWHMIDDDVIQLVGLVKNNVGNRSKTKRVSSDGVFFRCDNCGFEPHMKSSTDDLLIMNYCPKCGSEFE